MLQPENKAAGFSSGPRGSASRQRSVSSDPLQGPAGEISLDFLILILVKSKHTYNTYVMFNIAIYSKMFAFPTPKTVCYMYMNLGR